MSAGEASGDVRPSAAWQLGVGRVGGRDLVPSRVLAALRERIGPVRAVDLMGDVPPALARSAESLVEDALVAMLGPSVINLLVLGAVLRHPGAMGVEIDEAGEATLTVTWDALDPLAADVLTASDEALVAWWDRLLALLMDPPPRVVRGRTPPVRLVQTPRQHLNPFLSGGTD